MRRSPRVVVTAPWLLGAESGGWGAESGAGQSGVAAADGALLPPPVLDLPPAESRNFRGRSADAGPGSGSGQQHSAFPIDAGRCPGH
uniref:Putative secreted protein n=1 Tax=Ixodes ricinus TaxID=34613 RepID=A0A6B0UFN1_IXORI